MVYLWDDELGLQTFPYNKFRYAYTPSDMGEYTSLYGDKVTKTFRFDSGNKKIFESDVSRETRVLTDLYLESDEVSVNHHICFFDIEVSSEGGFPDPLTADKKITAISLYSSKYNRYITFILDPEEKTKDYVAKADEKVLMFNTEVELLEAFLEIWKKMNFTVISGWNSDNFDIPYIVRRLDRVLGESASRLLSVVELIRFNEFRQQYAIAGLSCLDYMKLYKKYNPVQKPSYRLQDIAMGEIKEGKTDYDGSLEKLYQQDRLKFLEYSIQDVRLLVKLDAHLKYIQLAMTICHICHVQYEDFQYSSKFIEGAILTYLHRKKIVAPNKPEGGREEFERKQEEDEEGFAGAFVKPPLPGLYEYVYSLDLQSLYPSIIMSLNISPETKLGKITDWNVKDFVNGVDRTYTLEQDGATNEVSAQYIRNLMDTMPINISAAGIIYRTDKLGVIPEILDTWFVKRKEYKALSAKHGREGNVELENYYDRLQQVQKVFLNSIYGVLGLAIFRFYDIDNAASVTLSGQHVIMNSSDFISRQYIEKNAPRLSQHTIRKYEDVLREEMKEGRLDEDAYRWLKGRDDDFCIYIDTDSVYFSAVPLFKEDMADSDKVDFSITLAKEMESKLNTFYDDMSKNLFNCTKHRLVIKGETLAQPGFWIRKKRYALKRIYDLEKNKSVDINEPPKAKGLDMVRSSFPPAFKKMMESVLNDILLRKSKRDIDDSILKFVSTKDSIPFKDMAKTSSVKDMEKYLLKMYSRIDEFLPSTPIQVKAAFLYNRVMKKLEIDKLYNPIRSKDKIKYVYLKPNPFGVSVMAFKTYDDPPEIMKLVEEYIDREKIVERELENKLQKFYDALGWGDIPTKINQLGLDLFEEI